MIKRWSKFVLAIIIVKKVYKIALIIKKGLVQSVCVKKKLNNLKYQETNKRINQNFPKTGVNNLFEDLIKKINEIIKKKR